MIPSGLERLIQKGKAQAHTWVHGIGGVGRIPIGENQFIVIYHFDYFGFVDLPTQTNFGTAASATFTITSTLPFTVHGINIDIENVGVTADFTIDTTDPVGSLAAAQTYVSLIAPGYVVSVSVIPGGLSFTVQTTTPGNTFNGDDLKVALAPPFSAVPPVLVDGVFAGGTAAVIATLDEILKRSVHQVIFRSKKSNNHFIIRDDVQIFDAEVFTGDPTSFFLSVLGSYKKDCYLVHEDHVQLNIMTVPDPEDWNLVDYSALAQKSQEANVPQGYGQIGGGGLDTVRQVRLDAVGNDQQYFPLTQVFEEAPNVPLTSIYRDQFRVDGNVLNNLKNPQTNIGNIRWNRRSYPIINIDYVLVNMNLNEFVQSTNG
jgi:hypothetical protein